MNQLISKGIIRIFSVLLSSVIIIEGLIIMEGNKKDIKTQKQEFLNSLSLEEHYEYYKKQNYDKKEIIKKIAKDRDTNKNEIYQYFIGKSS